MRDRAFRWVEVLELLAGSFLAATLAGLEGKLALLTRVLFLFEFCSISGQGLAIFVKPAAPSNQYLTDGFLMMLTASLRIRGLAIRITFRWTPAICCLVIDPNNCRYRRFLASRKVSTSLTVVVNTGDHPWRGIASAALVRATPARPINQHIVINQANHIPIGNHASMANPGCN